MVISISAWKRRQERKQELKQAQEGHYTGLALYDHLQEITGDNNPWIECPIGIFYSEKTKATLIGNQITGVITQLYKAHE